MTKGALTEMMANSYTSTDNMKIILNRFSLPLLYATFIAVLLLMPIQPCLPIYAQEPEVECWAVIIGVSDYEYLSDLTFCDNDAQELSQELSSAWGEDHIKVLLNDEATRSDIKNAILGWLAPKEDIDDTVLLFFSGHAYEEALFPYDSLLEYYDNDIFADDLNAWLDKLDSRQIVIIIDTCLSGSFFREIGKSGRVVMMAGSPEEVAYDSEALRHGVFSYYILEALREWEFSDTNQDYEISAEESFYYAQPKAISFSEINEPTTQHPLLSDNYAGQLGLLMKATFATNYPMPSDATILTIGEKTCLGRDLPVSFIWIPGSTHNFSIPSSVPAGEGTRYIFNSWNDGSTSTVGTISHGGAYTANYEKQYYLTIESEYGKPEGEGWYSAGSTATISVTSPLGAITQQVFTEWSGDFTGSTPTASVTMDKPQNVTANWQTNHTRLHILIAIGVAVVAGVISHTIITRQLKRKASK